MKLPAALFCLAFAVTLCGCSDEGEDDFDFSLDGTVISISDIMGDWVATKAEFSVPEGPVVTYDVVAEGGTVLMNINANGRFTLELAPVGMPVELITGRMGFDEDILAVQFDDDPDDWIYMGFVLDEPNLQLAGGPLEEAFDFDADGTDDPAYIDFQFTRD